MSRILKFSTSKICGTRVIAICEHKAFPQNGLMQTRPFKEEGHVFTDEVYHQCRGCACGGEGLDTTTSEVFGLFPQMSVVGDPVGVAVEFYDCLACQLHTSRRTHLGNEPVDRPRTWNVYLVCDLRSWRLKKWVMAIHFQPPSRILIYLKSEIRPVKSCHFTALLFVRSLGISRNSNSPKGQCR